MQILGVGKKHDIEIGQLEAEPIELINLFYPIRMLTWPELAASPTPATSPTIAGRFGNK